MEWSNEWKIIHKVNHCRLWLSLLIQQSFLTIFPKHKIILKLMINPVVINPDQCIVYSPVKSQQNKKSSLTMFLAAVVIQIALEKNNLKAPCSKSILTQARSWEPLSQIAERTKTYGIPGKRMPHDALNIRMHHFTYF